MSTVETKPAGIDPEILADLESVIKRIIDDASRGSSRDDVWAQQSVDASAWHPAPDSPLPPVSRMLTTDG
jgi:hypothetical protein